MDQDALNELAEAAKTSSPPLHAPRMRVGFPERLMMGVGDYVLLMGASILGAIVYFAFFEEKYRGSKVILQTLCLGIGLLYCLPELWTGTLSKRIANVRIARTDGMEATSAQRVVRWMIKFSPLLVLTGCVSLEWMAFLGTTTIRLRPIQERMAFVAFLAGLVNFCGLILAAFPRRQALHDLLAGTVVLRDSDIHQGRAFEAVVKVKTATDVEGCGVE